MSEIRGLVSLVIVNWNGMEYMPECLESVYVQTYPQLEILVVDNGSVDGSRDWLRKNSEDRFILIELKSNIGFSGGANAGIRAARGEYIAILNNDAVADPEWLHNLVECMEDPDIGMVASKILFYDRRGVIDKAGHLLYPDGLNRGRGAGDVDNGQYDTADEVFFPDGCAALYRNQMLEEVGLFDEDFFAYGDDADLGLRGRWRGWNCIYSPGARVYHRHSSSLGKYSTDKAFLVERNRLWVAVKLLPMPLLCVTPLFTLWRFGWHIVSMFGKRGLAGRVRTSHSSFGLFYALIRAYLSGTLGMAKMIQKRRHVFGSRCLDNAQFYELLRRFRISARDLALRD